MTESVPTLTTVAYRSHLALTAATGGELSPIAFLAFGTGTRAYSPDEDAALQAEAVRLPATATATGPEVTASALLPGTAIAGLAITEVGAFTESGVLVVRKTIPPIELASYGEMDFDIVFEY
ncbi:hypothetical protein [Stutzerimonas xanthomarina]|uniref:hypothetical protein n=1 Tax=Stutzerimonas xanthomarina TaxID=271420 RepID=UPI003AA84273